LAPDSLVIAVVKANAYGHGLEGIVQSLSAPAPAGADGFAVATLAEGRRIRACGVVKPVILLEGITEQAELQLVQDLDLQLVVHSDFQIAYLEQLDAVSKPIKVWLKIDTGMHRLGLPIAQAGLALQRLRAMPQVDPDVVLMSHLANADDPQDSKTERQTQRLEKLASELQVSNCSLANSAGIIAWPDTRQQAVRAGLMLYGVSPIKGQDRDQLGLRPCMTLKSSLIAISQCERDDAIGYGGSWRCPEAMPIGVVALGYGDGYPRAARNGTPVLVNGVSCPLVGRVSMDMLTVDLRPLPQAAIGDEVILWGDGLPVEVVAEHAGMIPYELICGVTERVETVYAERDPVLPQGVN
jgi:alanine racemase